MTTTASEIEALTTAHHPDDWTDVDTRAVDTVRVLAADAVQKVGNGHPGTAMSLAPLAYTLYQRVMDSDPARRPEWPGRDRFVLSCGHSSLTQYIQLYLRRLRSGTVRPRGAADLGVADPRAPRGAPHQGRRDHHRTARSGPGLGGRAWPWPRRRERGLFDPDAAPGESPFDHFIYVITSDGDMEEGITSEASSIAGRQQLGNLIVFYDHNQISIEDDTNIALSEDVAARYEAYGWHMQKVEGGENVVGILDGHRERQAGHRPAVVHPGPDDHRLPGAGQA